MYNRMDILSDKDFDLLHENTLRVFEQVGVAFHSEKALDIFKRHDIKVENGVVYLGAKDVEKALATTPSSYKIHARNPQHDVVMGGDNLVIAPGYGAPFVVKKGVQHRAVLEDYRNFCKLVQTSNHIDYNGMLMGDPSDIPADRGHLHMMLANLVNCDKPFIGSSVSERAALDSIEMAGIAFGGKENIQDKPVTMGIISSLSPLAYSSEMAEALIVYAEYGQVNMVALLSQGGSTAPVTLPGLLVTQNAEILAGIVLTQLVNPGSPVIYGSTSTVTDMKTGSLAIGAPEQWLIQNATQQMGQRYGLPTRGSGGITDAHCLDMQAGIESALSLGTTVMSGANFLLHGCGILGAYIAMSFEKFLADEEICGMLRRNLKGLGVTEERIDFATIKEVGPGGEYLTHPATFKHCRTEFYLPEIMRRNDYSTWSVKGKKEIFDIAEKKVEERLEQWREPEMDGDIRARLEKYVEQAF
ncbi:trimethylamine methyltransferase family protein [Desulforhopalus singaporensis]|uniref:Methyltransferase n=1 Tax=Desulforhopalus singaporensis TaxID=91360 RepID=A0A1H0KFC2_9BACT|nr:trimethylamine methyltransferase family protein [Desulforhopalus singaporensis]SDO54412.1 trimethylamine---corrinoid protein Co-methyltransferase [Desulforhopalus singaporensis]